MSPLPDTGSAAYGSLNPCERFREKLCDLRSRYSIHSKGLQPEFWSCYRRRRQLGEPVLFLSESAPSGHAGAVRQRWSRLHYLYAGGGRHGLLFLPHDLSRISQESGPWAI